MKRMDEMRPAEEEFEELRPLLFSIAYRMLGSVAEAEDIVQEAWLRWEQADRSVIRSAKAFLSTITTRLCVDYLRSARVRRERYIGPWLPEPLMTEVAPPASETAELADSLSLAFLTLLESLTPLGRAAFLLKEVFDFEYPEIAEILERSQPSCRQLVARARKHLDTRRPRVAASREQHQLMTMEFMRACATGDLGELMKLLTDDVVLWADGGGKVRAARKPIYGPEKVTRFVRGIIRKAEGEYEVGVDQINGGPAIALRQGGRVQDVISLDVAGDRIQGIWIIVNPDKLARL
jgi:RNA polymerase sigma-70 factor (ECF subfamily)